MINVWRCIVRWILVYTVADASAGLMMSMWSAPVQSSRQRDVCVYVRQHVSVCLCCGNDSPLCQGDKKHMDIFSGCQIHTHSSALCSRCIPASLLPKSSLFYSFSSHLLSISSSCPGEAPVTAKGQQWVCSGGYRVASNTGKAAQPPVDLPRALKLSLLQFVSRMSGKSHLTHLLNNSEATGGGCSPWKCRGKVEAKKPKVQEVKYAEQCTAGRRL